MKRILGSILVLLSLVFVLGIAGCGGSEEQGPMEEAGEQADEAMEEAGDAMENAGDAVGGDN